MDIAAIWAVTVGVLLVILGLNALIVVHEFGHFAAARLCGVRCEKFYIWFDFWGLRFFRFKWGDTEYGLGLFPLGGYLKMLGQEDNPGAIQAEIERAKQESGVRSQESGAEEAAQERGGVSPPVEKAADGRLTQETGGLTPPAHAQPSIFAPDSYLSKSVPQRLFIIVSGVVMNFLFAIVCAAGAYLIGVTDSPSAVGGVVPGSPAWQANLQSGDRIIAIDGKPAKIFQDIREKMIEGNKTTQLTVDRQGEIITIDISPRRREGDLAPTIGVLPLPSLELHPNIVYPQWEKYCSPESLEVLKNLPKTEPLRIEKIDGQAVNSYAEYQEAQLKNIGKPVLCTISGGTINGVNVKIPAIPMREIPVRFKMGTITAVLPGSDADKQGIVPGDTIVSLDGDASIDPLKLPKIVLNKVNAEQDTVVLGIKKSDGTEQTLTVALKPIRSLPEITLMSMREPLGSTALGLSWHVEPIIAAVDESKLASGQPIPAIGDKVVSVEFVNSEPIFIGKTSFCENRKEGFLLREVGNRIEIPHIFVSVLQEVQPKKQPEKIDAREAADAKTLFVRLILESPDKTVKVVDLPILESDTWFNTERGLVLKLEETLIKAEGLAEALRLGTDKTIKYTLLVYTTLDGLINGQVSARALAGPVGIVTFIYKIAQDNWSAYLMLLCLIGANLAVINLLPIPPLDGGHVVFLAYEGIFRRPPNELVQVILSYFGLFLIILLMVWTLTLDLTCIPRV